MVLKIGVIRRGRDDVGDSGLEVRGWGGVLIVPAGPVGAGLQVLFVKGAYAIYP